MSKVKVFKRYVNEFNTLADLSRKTSMTIPDDSLTIQELFDRYSTAAGKQELAYANQQAIYDGENPCFDDFQPELDAVAAYEMKQDMLQQAYENRLRNNESLKINQNEQESEHIQEDRKSINDSSGDSGSIKE